MTDAAPMSETELDEIERRLAGAFRVAPPPWAESLETRWGTGGESFVQFLGNPDVDNEMYFEVHLGPERLKSPDPRIDLLVDFIGHAPADIGRLLSEVRRLRKIHL